MLILIAIDNLTQSNKKTKNVNYISENLVLVLIHEGSIGVNSQYKVMSDLLCFVFIQHVTVFISSTFYVVTENKLLVTTHQAVMF